MAVFHSSLERQRVDLLQGTFVELRIDLKPVFLLRVHVVVLGGGDDGVTLNALNVASGHLPRQHGVLPKRLEQATENWDASDVHSWPKQDIVSGTPCLLAQHIAVLLGRREIPGGRQGDGSPRGGHLHGGRCPVPRGGLAGSGRRPVRGGLGGGG